MNKLLQDREYNLRPYNMYVAVFDQKGESVPTLYKILYNDFIKPLDILWSGETPGYYAGSINNLSELNIKESDVISISCELLYGQALDMRIEGLLNSDHSVITVVNYILSFFSREHIDGKFVITYSKMKS